MVSDACPTLLWAPKLLQYTKHKAVFHVAGVPVYRDESKASIGQVVANAMKKRNTRKDRWVALYTMAEAYTSKPLKTQS